MRIIYPMRIKRPFAIEISHLSNLYCLLHEVNRAFSTLLLVYLSGYGCNQVNVVAYDIGRPEIVCCTRYQYSDTTSD